MDYILIDPDVIETIRSETARFPDSECAGLLLGAVKNEIEPIKIMKSYCDGPLAEQSGYSVSPDVDFFNKLIIDAEKEGLEFVGEWHKHPGMFSSPSSGDVAAIEEIMKLNKLDVYIAMIITGFGERAEMHPYLFRLGASYHKVTYRTQLLPIEHRLHENRMPHEIDSERAIATTNQIKTNQETEEAKLHNPQSSPFANALERLRVWLLREKTSRQKKDAQSVEKKEENPVSRAAWYESEIGKKMLLIEKKSMNQRFPDFSLFKKDRLLFWSSTYNGIRIVLAYPETYPTRPLIIELRPSLQKLSNEGECFYAVLAAQIAYLRIDSQGEIQSPIVTD